MPIDKPGFYEPPDDLKSIIPIFLYQGEKDKEGYTIYLQNGSSERFSSINPIVTSSNLISDPNSKISYLRKEATKFTDLADWMSSIPFIDIPDSKKPENISDSVEDSSSPFGEHPNKNSGPSNLGPEKKYSQSQPKLT